MLPFQVQPRQLLLTWICEVLTPVQESADSTGAGAGTVAAADTVDGTTTVAVTDDAADDAVAGAFGYRGSNRYAGITVTGTTGSSADISVYAILNKPHRAATTFIGTAVART